MGKCRYGRVAGANGGAYLHRNRRSEIYRLGVPGTPKQTAFAQADGGALCARREEAANRGNGRVGIRDHASSEPFRFLAIEFHKIRTCFEGATERLAVSIEKKPAPVAVCAGNQIGIEILGTPGGRLPEAMTMARRLN